MGSRALPALSASLALLVVSLSAFACLALAYKHEPFVTIDREVADWAADVPSWLEWIARPFSWLGGWIGLTVLGIVLGVLLVRGRAWIELGFLLVAIIGSQIAVAVLKAWFDRPRPDVGSAVALPSSASFPSAHAAAGVACLGAAAVLVSERLPSRRERVTLWSIVAVTGALVGLSRVALNVHYLTDVAAGWCFGLAWLAGSLIARDHAERPVSRRK